MATQLRRDPFARATLMRQLQSHRSDCRSCDWCGQLTTLYKYWWEGDDASSGGPSILPQAFCSVACWQAYHG